MKGECGEGARWVLFSDPSVMIVLHLEGQPGLRRGWGVLSWQLRIWLCVGVPIELLPSEPAVRIRTVVSYFTSLSLDFLFSKNGELTPSSETGRAKRLALPSAHSECSINVGYHLPLAGALNVSSTRDVCVLSTAVASA